MAGVAANAGERLWSPTGVRQLDRGRDVLERNAAALGCARQARQGAVSRRHGAGVPVLDLGGDGVDLADQRVEWADDLLEQVTVTTLRDAVRSLEPVVSKYRRKNRFSLSEKTLDVVLLGKARR